MIAACKLGPVISHEEVKKKKNEQNMSAKNIIKTHLEKIVLFYNYFINNNIDFFITAGVIAGVSREVSGSCA